MRIDDGRVRVGYDSWESMSGDVFLSEFFVRALSSISAMEQIVYPCVVSYVLGFMVRFSVLVLFEFCSHSSFAS